MKRRGLRLPTHGPNGGVADSLDEAKAAFRAAWEAGGRGVRSRKRKRTRNARADYVC